MPSPEAPTPLHRSTAFQLIAAFLLLGLGTWAQTGITGQDEYWLSFRTPMEMLERDSWWTPWVNDEVRLRKPPLLYWLMAANYSVFGPSYWSARIWCVLAGVGIVWVTRRLYREVFAAPGELAGWLALASAGIAVESRRAMFDLPMAFFAAWTVLLLVRWARSGSRACGLGAGVTLALGFMTKGPVVLLFVGTAIVAATAVGPVRARFRGQVGTATGALVAFCVLGLPWFVSIHLLHPEFQEVMAEEARSRRIGLQLGSLGPVAGGLFLNLFPWCFALLGALIATATRFRDLSHRHRWLLLWIGISALPFLTMKTFERYLIPLVVPGCLLTAHYLSAMARTAVARAHVVGAVVLLGVPTFAFAGFGLWFGTSVVGPILGISGFVAVVVLARRCATPETLVPETMVPWVGVQMALVLGVTYPSLGVNALPDDLPEDLAQRNVAVYHRPQPGMLSMHIGRSVTHLDPEDARWPDALGAHHGYIFALAQDLAPLRSAANSANVQLVERGRFRSFYARSQFLKFYRKGASGEDWRTALRHRDPTSLQPEFVIFETSR